LKGFKTGLVYASSAAPIFDVGFAYFRPLGKNTSVVSEVNLRYGADILGGYGGYGSLVNEVTIVGANVPALFQLSTNNGRRFMVYLEGGVSADLLFGGLSFPDFPEKDRTLTVFNLGMPVGLGMAFRGKRTRVDINFGGVFGTAYNSITIIGLRILPW
jgi:hypothetical protein